MDCKLTDDKGKTLAMGSRDQMTRYLKNHVPDGMYALQGPDMDMAYYRDGGVVYPCGGVCDGQKMPPRTLAECKEVFGK